MNSGDESRKLASSPCMMDEMEAELIDAAAARKPSGVGVWRRAERARQLAARLDIGAGERREHSRLIAGLAHAVIGDTAGKCVSFYWPIKGEPDLRPLIDRVIGEGGRCALPVVREKAQPLDFRSWAPGEELTPGLWNIPVPAAGVPVVPDIVIAPVVAFDAAGYRLGYGGGYFDRTLAAMPAARIAVGVGYASARIETIYPQVHDIPMDYIVTQEAVLPRTSQARAGN